MTLTGLLGMLLVTLLGLAWLAVAQSVKEFRRAVEAMDRDESYLAIPKASVLGRAHSASSYPRL